MEYIWDNGYKRFDAFSPDFLIGIFCSFFTFHAARGDVGESSLRKHVSGSIKYSKISPIIH